MIDHVATITEVNRDGQNLPVSLSLDSAPTIPTTTVLDYTLYAVDAARTSLPLSGSPPAENNSEYVHRHMFIEAQAHGPNPTVMPEH